MWRNLWIATCPLPSWMVAEEACCQIWICHLDDRFNYRVWSWDRHRNPHDGYIVRFSLCWKDEEDEEKCSTFFSWVKKAESDKYENVQGVTKGNVNEYRINELTRSLKEWMRWYDWKHRRNASFYLVNDSRMLAWPATNISNSFNRLECGTNTGRWQLCLRVVHWLLLMKKVIAMR